MRALFSGCGSETKLSLSGFDFLVMSLVVDIYGNIGIRHIYYCVPAGVACGFHPPVRTSSGRWVVRQPVGFWYFLWGLWWFAASARDLLAFLQRKKD